MMKICLIGGIYGKGGVRSTYMKRTPETTLEDGLREAGHQVTTLSHYDDVAFGGFDVVHVHHLSYGAARLASDPSGVPFVFTAHDASHMNGMPLGRVRLAAMRYILSRTDGIVSLSSAEADFQRSHYKVAGAELAVIPNGIDASLYSLAPRNGNRRKVWKLLFVGQLIPLKGCDLLLRALALLPAALGCELSLAYQNAQQQEELEALAASLGLAQRVKFLGKQEPRQLADLYRSHDLLVLPSATEALPSVVTEAMLCGLPFVATAVGGIREQAGGFGRLVTQRTPDELAIAIAEVIDQYEEHAAKAAAMSAYAQRTFSIPAMVEAHEALYRRLAGRRMSRRGSAKKWMDVLVRAGIRYRGSGRTAPSSQRPETTVRTT